MTIYGKRADGSELTTQWETVLYFLQQSPEQNKITSGGIWKEFGFTRLSSIVMQIEKHTGVRLPRKTIVVKNRYGGKIHVTEYWWPENVGSNEKK